MVAQSVIPSSGPPAQASDGGVGRLPGVYLERQTRSTTPELETGVPAFVGVLDASFTGIVPFAGDGPALLDYAMWSALEASARAGWARGRLGFAVRGFFENGGRRCYVAAAPSADDAGLEVALAALEPLDDFDLLCAPDWACAAQAAGRLTCFCEARTGCFAILDSIGSPALTSGLDAAAIAAAAPGDLTSADAALYGPWLQVRGACVTCGGSGRLAGGASCATCWGTGQGCVPPSGHVAGIYARADAATGVHKAPANERLEGVIDLQLRIDDAAQSTLAGRRINCLRAFPGRGIRVWGARTCSLDPAWTYVNVRRLFLTIARWLTQAMASVAFEPNDLPLWVRISREVGAFLEELYRAGALQGDSAGEAFYVKCDAETNPPAARDAGMVVTEVGVAAASPSEFIVVRLVAGAAGVSVSAASPPAAGA
jgi:hypothetical protein